MSDLPWVRCESCGKEVRGRFSRQDRPAFWMPYWHKNWSGKPCSGRLYEAELVEREDAAIARAEGTGESDG